MLVLSRKIEQEIIINDGAIRIKVLGIHRGKVSLGITAGKEISIERDDVKSKPTSATKRGKTN